jgi:hypothetical protein
MRDIEIIEPDGAFTGLSSVVYLHHSHNKGTEKCFNESRRTAHRNISLRSSPHGIRFPEELLVAVLCRRARRHGSWLAAVDLI